MSITPKKELPNLPMSPTSLRSAGYWRVGRAVHGAARRDPAERVRHLGGALRWYVSRMATSAKGMRKIHVGGSTYHWRALGTDDGIQVVIVGEDAFVSGQRGQQLRFTVPYRSVHLPNNAGWGLRQRSIVAPGVVGRAVAIALRRDPAFTARAGEPDVDLDAAEVAQALAELGLDGVRADLARALSALENVVLGACDAELFMGYVLAVGRPTDHEASELIANWFRAAAPQIRAAAGEVRAYVRASEDYFVGTWPAWQNVPSRGRERRHAIALFTSFCEAAGLGDVAASIDCGALDAALAACNRQRI